MWAWSSTYGTNTCSHSVRTERTFVRMTATERAEPANRRGRARIAGVASSAAVVATTAATRPRAPARCRSAPRSAPRSPARAAGRRASRTSRRRSRARAHSSGTWRISVDSQTALPSIIATPPSSAPDGEHADRRARGEEREREREQRRRRAAASTSGRRGRARTAIRRAEQRADAHRAEHRPPRRGAAELALGDHRAERRSTRPRRMLPTPAASTNVHTQVSERNIAPALAQVGEERGAARARHARRQPQAERGTAR